MFSNIVLPEDEKIVFEVYKTPKPFADGLPSGPYILLPSHIFLRQDVDAEQAKAAIHEAFASNSVEYSYDDYRSTWTANYVGIDDMCEYFYHMEKRKVIKNFKISLFHRSQNDERLVVELQNYSRSYNKIPSQVFSQICHTIGEPLKWDINTKPKST